jgi:hypothetical protein
MSENYDDLFDEIQETQTTTPSTPETVKTSDTKEYSKEEFAAKMKAERENVSELINVATTEIAGNSLFFQSYLNTLSKFEKYSAHNTLLIFAQKPDATQLKSYDNWVNSKTPVNKGEKGISIYEPGKEYTRDDGTTAVSMNIKKMFDISQTSAEIKAAPENKDIRVLLKSLMKTSPAPVKLVDPIGDNIGARYNEQRNVIEVSRGLDGENLFRAISQEVAFASLYKQSIETSSFEDINFAAYAASYVICEKNGIETKGYDFSESAEYFKDKDSKEIIGEIKAIRDSVNEISGNMVKELNPPQKDAKTQDAR